MFLSLAIGITFRPAIAFGVVLLMPLIDQWAVSSSVYFVTHQSLTNILVGLLVLEGILVRSLRGELGIGNYPAVGWIVLALFAWSALTILWSIASVESIALWRRHLPYVLAVVIASPLLVNRFDDLRHAFGLTLALGGVLLLSVNTMREWSARSLVLPVEVKRGSIIETDTSALALASAAAIIGLISLLANSRGIARWSRILSWSICVLAVATIIRCGARGQFLAFVAVAIVTIPMSKKLRNVRGFVATGFAILVVSAAVFWGFENFETSRFERTNIFVDYQEGRLNRSRIVLEHWFEAGPSRWLLGLGTSSSYSPELLGIYPHVVPIEILVELGIVGLSAFLAIVWQSGRNSYRAFRLAEHDPVSRGLVAIITGVTFFYLVICLKQGSLLNSPILYACVIVLGRIAGLSRSACVRGDNLQNSALNERPPYGR